MKKRIRTYMDMNNGSKSVLYIQKSFRVIKPLLKVPKMILRPIRKTVRKNNAVDSRDKIYRKISAEEISQYKKALRIVFCGDLILLEDQVRRGFDGQKYDYSEMFEYTKECISSADLAIGVLEGPLAGEDAGYSSSNYGDGKRLALNFPDAFAIAVKDAGFDVVTLATNHLLDKGVDGVHRTIDVLDNIGLTHIGAYRSEEEKIKNRIKVIDCDDIKIAILAYTYGCNGYNVDSELRGELSYITSLLIPPSHKDFNKVKESVKKDFEYAKSHNPDLIIAMPHMGSQFLKSPDYYQKTWADIFREFGADIILADHTHSVQPVSISKFNEKLVYTSYCPGNYANVYRDYNGDAGILGEVYIDRQSKKIIGGGVIPMWTYAPLSGNYKPVPIHNFVHNKAVKEHITTFDLDRVKTVHNIITKTVFNHPFDINTSLDIRYYFDKNGFIRLPAKPITLTEDMKNGVFYKAVNSVKSICFVGDSITEGSKNCGYPWYEPLEEHLTCEVHNRSWGSGTVQTLLNHSDEIIAAKAELYVIAIGTNDVRYRNSNCAMNEKEYLNKLNELCKLIRKENAKAQFVFIAPWTSIDGDPYCSLAYRDKILLNNKYSAALEEYCSLNGHKFINANPAIDEKINFYPSSNWLIDHIHPNANAGIMLYSQAVLLY